MSEKIWSDDAWEDYLCRQTQDKKTKRKTGSSTIWKTGGSISLIAEAIMEINNLGLTSEL